MSYKTFAFLVYSFRCCEISERYKFLEVYTQHLEKLNTFWVDLIEYLFIPEGLNSEIYLDMLENEFEVYYLNVIECIFNNNSNSISNIYYSTTVY